MNFEIAQREYFDHPYNDTINNERAIEIPLALRYIEKVKDLDTFIELGAVLPYYFENLKHSCIDPVDSKATISDYAENINYFKKHVLSISTLEHIGTNDYGLKANFKVNPYEVLKRIYEDCSSCLISWPIGYNSSLDDDFFNLDQFDCTCFIRINHNKWEEVQKNKLKLVKYNFPFCFGNGLVFVYK